VWVLELFNSSKTMTRRGRHVQRGLVSSSIANGLPPPESQLHTQQLQLECMLLYGLIMQTIPGFQFLGMGFTIQLFPCLVV
jgi:hypothetical protein